MPQNQALCPKQRQTSPLTATSALEVEEARLTGTAVPPGDVRQALTLPGHLIATRLLIHSAVGIAVTSCKNKRDGEICRKLGVPCCVGILLACPRSNGPRSKTHGNPAPAPHNVFASMAVSTHKHKHFSKLEPPNQDKVTHCC